MASYNAQGVKVRTLMNAFQNAVAHALVWDAKNDQNTPVASGIYFCRLETDDFSIQKKMILIRQHRSADILSATNGLFTFHELRITCAVTRNT